MQAFDLFVGPSPSDTNQTESEQSLTLLSQDEGASVKPRPLHCPKTHPSLLEPLLLLHLVDYHAVSEAVKSLLSLTIHWLGIIKEFLIGISSFLSYLTILPGEEGVRKEEHVHTQRNGVGVMMKNEEETFWRLLRQSNSFLMRLRQSLLSSSDRRCTQFSIQPRLLESGVCSTVHMLDSILLYSPFNGGFSVTDRVVKLRIHCSVSELGSFVSVHPTSVYVSE